MSLLLTLPPELLMNILQFIPEPVLPFVAMTCKMLYGYIHGDGMVCKKADIVENMKRRVTVLSPLGEIMKREVTTLSPFEYLQYVFYAKQKLGIRKGETWANVFFDGEEQDGTPCNFYVAH